jgi:hypothetical protein
MGNKINATFIWCSFGIMLNMLYFSLLGFSYAFEAFYEEGAEFARATFFITNILSFLAYYLVGKRLVSCIRLIIVVASILGFLGIGMLALAYRQTLLPPLAFSISGCVFAALGYGWSFLSFFEIIEQTFTNRQVCLLSALFLTYPLYGMIIIITSPANSQVMLTAILPVLVCVCSLKTHPSTRQVWGGGG